MDEVIFVGDMCGLCILVVGVKSLTWEGDVMSSKVKKEETLW